MQELKVYVGHTEKKRKKMKKNRKTTKIRPEKNQTRREAPVLIFSRLILVFFQFFQFFFVVLPTKVLNYCLISLSLFLRIILLYLQRSVTNTIVSFACCRCAGLSAKPRKKWYCSGCKN